MPCIRIVSVACAVIFVISVQLLTLAGELANIRPVIDRVRSRIGVAIGLVVGFPPVHVSTKLFIRCRVKEIAKLQGTSIKTSLSRYSYGLNKLRSMLNSEVEK